MRKLITLLFLVAFTTVFAQTREYPHNIKGYGWIQYKDTLKADFSIQDYYITHRAGDRLSFVAADSNCIVDLFGGDGDGLEQVIWNLWAKGTPTDVSNGEWLRIWYNLSNDEFCITTKAQGTGQFKDLVISADGTNSQFRILTNGNISADGIINYNNNRAASFVPRSLVDKNYVDSTLTDGINSTFAEVLMVAQDGSTMNSTVRSFLSSGANFLGFSGVGVPKEAGFSFIVPQNYVSGGTFDIYGVSDATTDSLGFEIDVTISGAGENRETITETISFKNTIGSVADNDEWRINDYTILSAISPGDAIAIVVRRLPNNSGDTYTGIAYLEFIKFQYN